MREDYIVFKDVAVCRFCGTLLSRDVESVPACDCGQNKKIGENNMKKAFEVLLTPEGATYGTAPTCVEIMTDNHEQDVLKAAQEKYGERVHLFPCRLDATIQSANTPHDNKKMRGYGGLGI